MKRALSPAAVITVLVLLVSSGASDGISAKQDVSIAVVGDQQVVGKPFDEITVLQVADAYERARGPLPLPKI